MNSTTAAHMIVPQNAAQALYLPWLQAHIEGQARHRHGFIPAGTPKRKRSITDRAARKALAREVAAQRRAHLEAGGSYRSFAFRSVD